MFLVEEVLREIPYLQFNKRGFQKFLGTNIPESTFSYQIEKELKSYYNKYNCVNRPKYLYFELHKDDIIEKSKRVRNYYELEKETGIPYSVLKRESKNYKFNLKSNSSFLTQEIRDKISLLFLDEPFSPIESYFYGYYLGDGFEDKADDGSSKSIGIVCCCIDDYDNFKKIESYLDCGEFMRSVNRGNGYKLEIRESDVVNRLKNKGLLFNSKCNNHPYFDKDMLKYFDFIMLLRGLIDSDGTVIKNVNSGEYCIKIRMVCENIVRSVYEKLQDIGVYSNFYNYDHKGYQHMYYLSIPGKGMKDLLRLGIYDKYPDLYIERKKVESPEEVKKRLGSK